MQFGLRHRKRERERERETEREREREKERERETEIERERESERELFRTIQSQSFTRQLNGTPFAKKGGIGLLTVAEVAIAAARPSSTVPGSLHYYKGGYENKEPQYTS